MSAVSAVAYERTERAILRALKRGVPADVEVLLDLVTVREAVLRDVVVGERFLERVLYKLGRRPEVAGSELSVDRRS